MLVRRSNRFVNSGLPFNVKHWDSYKFYVLGVVPRFVVYVRNLKHSECFDEVFITLHLRRYVNDGVFIYGVGIAPEEISIVKTVGYYVTFNSKGSKLVAEQTLCEHSIELVDVNFRAIVSESYGDLIYMQLSLA